jgi:Tol biopolymer transport system component
VLHRAQDGATRTLIPGASFDGAHAVAPDRHAVAFSYTTTDSTHLAQVDLADHTLRRLHGVEGAATYSLAWHPSDGRLAFAYHTPASKGTRGPGAVRIARPDGTTRSVGCSAAREVFAWLGEGTLAARNDERFYAVAASDCTTRTAADARQMVNLRYAPEASRLAYLHREYTYDSASGEYTPDSSLHLADSRVQSSTALFGNDRAVRHLRWSPDGTELAFDVAASEEGPRQVASYLLEEDRTVFLTPPDATTTDQTHPRWSPSGDYLAFTVQDGGTALAAVRTEGQTRRLGAVDGAVWGWLDERSVVVPGPDSLRIRTLDGSTRYTHPAPDALIHAWTPDPM